MLEDVTHLCASQKCALALECRTCQIPSGTFHPVLTKFPQFSLERFWKSSICLWGYWCFSSTQFSCSAVTQHHSQSLQSPLWPVVSAACHTNSLTTSYIQILPTTWITGEFQPHTDPAKVPEIHRFQMKKKRTWCLFSVRHFSPFK